MNRFRLTVIGLGNIICSDDGLGVHAVRRLRDRHVLPSRVELVEGGTAGLLLLPHLAQSGGTVIVDAIDIGAPPGTLVRLDGDEWGTALARKMTPHDVGLADLLGAARLTGAWPPRLVLHGIQPSSTEMGTELTPEVEQRLDLLVACVVGELASWGAQTVIAACGGRG